MIYQNRPPRKYVVDPKILLSVQLWRVCLQHAFEMIGAGFCLEMKSQAAASGFDGLGHAYPWIVRVKILCEPGILNEVWVDDMILVQ